MRCRSRRAAAELTIDLTDEEILEDLCWPHLPPGRWQVPGAEADPDGASMHQSGRRESQSWFASST